jgi:excisionase family DNA binding protein
MSDLKVYISTRQAAELLQVHESSVKRWCNASVLACEFTPGGHRRIPLRSMLEFARENDLSCPLMSFSGAETKLWAAIDKARQEGDYTSLADLLFDWLASSRTPFVVQLLPMLHAFAFDASVLFDRVVGPVLHRVGTGWEQGIFNTGDEHRMTQTVIDGVHHLRYEQLRELPPKNGRPRPVALVGCIEDDDHELGSMMVRVLLEREGWEVVYLGTKVPSMDFSVLQKKHNADLVCISVMPPQNMVHAARAQTILAHGYEEDKPFHLIYGGQAVRKTPVFPSPDAPFKSLTLFNDTASFISWLRSLDTP